IIRFVVKLISVKKVKGRLSQGERAPLALQYATYRTAICHVSHRERTPFTFSFRMTVYIV
ncbi:MAG: hypothetical protein IJ669_07920, partial [Prevotella sp.]|nr:hypothetical protein [Prevotella sp.]